VIGLDTNVLLRWLIDTSVWPEDSPDQTATVENYILHSGETFFVNHVVVAETIWVLKKVMKQPNNSIVDIVYRLLNSINVDIDRQVVVEDALAAFSHGTGDFSDHLIAAINAAAGCGTTLTFDRKASRSGRFTRLKTSGG